MAAVEIAVFFGLDDTLVKNPTSDPVADQKLVSAVNLLGQNGIDIFINSYESWDVAAAVATKIGVKLEKSVFVSGGIDGVEEIEEDGELDLTKSILVANKASWRTEAVEKGMQFVQTNFDDPANLVSLQKALDKVGYRGPSVL